MGIKYLDSPNGASGRIRYLDSSPKFGESVPFLPRLAEVSALQESRPSAIDVLKKEVMTPYSGNFLQRGVKAGVTGLKTIGVPFQIAESALASPMLSMQKGNFNPITLLGESTKGAVQSARGKKISQFGDVIRTTGFGSSFNEPIASTVGLFSSMKAINPVTKGQLVNSAKKAEQFIGSKLPNIMGKDYVLNRAKLADSGLDDLYKGLSGEYEKLYEKIGKIQVNPRDVENVINELPEQIINRISKSNLLGKTKNGEIVPDISNLKIIKNIIKQSVPDKIWSGKAIGDLNTAQLEQAYGKINSIMAKGNPELQALNSRYGEFMQMRKTISRVLYDADGNIQANGLAQLMSPGGERGKQVFFEQFSNQWPQAKQIMKDIVKFNQRKILKRGVGTALKFGLGFEAGRRFIVNPLMDKIGGQ